MFKIEEVELRIIEKYVYFMAKPDSLLSFRNIKPSIKLPDSHFSVFCSRYLSYHDTNRIKNDFAVEERWQRKIDKIKTASFTHFFSHFLR